MEKSVGEKLKECRTKRQWSQQELAEKLHVTRQAVSNWERDKTLPDVYMLKEIAAVFDMTLDEYMEDARQAEVKMPKTSGLFVMATFAVILLYLIIGGVSGCLREELVIEMIIISVFCLGIVHLYLSGSVKNGNFSMLAGYDSKVEYRVEEVKKVLIQMDMHICCVSFGAVLLLVLCTFLGERSGEYTSICVLMSYTWDYALAICFYNYRSIERTIVKEKDQKTAKAGYVSLIWFLGWVFLITVGTVVKFELESIENNSPESIGYVGWLLLAVIIIMVGLFFEQYRVKKEIEAERKYRPGKAFGIITVLTAAIVMKMFFLKF